MGKTKRKFQIEKSKKADEHNLLKYEISTKK